MFSYSTKLWPLCLIILLIFLQYRLWFESGGILDMLHLKKQLTTEIQENSQLKKRNELLLQQVQQLQNNKDSAEVRARRELGMIKKGEIFYQVIQ